MSASFDDFDLSSFDEPVPTGAGAPEESAILDARPGHEQPPVGFQPAGGNDALRRPIFTIKCPMRGCAVTVHTPIEGSQFEMLARHIDRTHAAFVTDPQEIERQMIEALRPPEEPQLGFEHVDADLDAAFGAEPEPTGEPLFGTPVDPQSGEMSVRIPAETDAA